MSSDFGTPGEKLPVSEDELVDREVLSPNHNERTMPIQMVVIHYTEMEKSAPGTPGSPIGADTRT